MRFREIRTATNNNLDHLQKDYVIIIWIYRIHELFCIFFYNVNGDICRTDD